MTDQPDQRGQIRQAGKWEGALLALICGSLILLFSLGIRHGFGLFLKPLTVDQGWGREVFSFAIALQNLVWGATQPFVGMLADRYSAPRIVAAGALLYTLGLWMMSSVTSEPMFILGAGILIGVGLSGTTFPVIFGTVSRLVQPEYRSLAMGITMAFASFGQFIMLPVTLNFISWLNWQGALVALSTLALLMFPLAFGLKEPKADAASAQNEKKHVPELSPLEAIKEALSMRDFWLLSFGFFACGFQVVFIAIHMPAYLADEGLDITVATTVLALIGLFNIAGTYYAGLLGGRRRKPMLLTWLYLLRGLTIAAFVLLPVSTFSAYLFGMVMGLFWLSTVPLTNGTVATVWGVKNMSMLGGVVFFWHQLGSFFGGWLGGWLYDQSGSYDSAWAIAIGLSLLSAILNWPIKETPANERNLPKEQQVSA